MLGADVQLDLGSIGGIFGIVGGVAAAITLTLQRGLRGALAASKENVATLQTALNIEREESRHRTERIEEKHAACLERLARQDAKLDLLTGEFVDGLADRVTEAVKDAFKGH